MCLGAEVYTLPAPAPGPELQLPLTPGAPRRSKKGKNDLLFTLQNQACIWITKTQRPEENPLHQEHEAVRYKEQQVRVCRAWPGTAHCAPYTVGPGHISGAQKYEIQALPLLAAAPSVHGPPAPLPISCSQPSVLVEHWLAQPGQQATTV